MAIKKVFQNFRVVIEPKALGNLGGVHVPTSWLYKDEAAIEKGYRDACKDIVTEVKRHIDGVDSVYVDCDVREECEHCGWIWKPDAKGLNGCCDKEVQEWITAHPGSTCEECTAWLVDGDPHEPTCSKAVPAAPVETKSVE